MPALRNRLSWLAIIWLVCQATGFAAAPVTFAARVMIAAEEGCDCPGTAPGQACPMHSHDAAKNDDGTCRLRNACAPDEAALLTIVGGNGITTQTAVVSIERIAVPVDTLVTSTLRRADLPDSPPPRA